MHLNIQFFFTCPFRLVKLPLGLAAHPPTLWTPGKIKFVFYTKKPAVGDLYLKVAYFSVKLAFCFRKSYLMWNNLHLKRIFFNAHKYNNTEWHELILFTLHKNTLLVTSHCILTLKSHQSTNICDDTLCFPPYLGVAVSFLTSWWGSITV